MFFVCLTCDKDDRKRHEKKILQQKFNIIRFLRNFCKYLKLVGKFLAKYNFPEVQLFKKWKVKKYPFFVKRAHHR